MRADGETVRARRPWSATSPWGPSPQQRGSTARRPCRTWSSRAVRVAAAAAACTSLLCLSAQQSHEVGDQRDGIWCSALVLARYPRSCSIGHAGALALRRRCPWSRPRARPRGRHVGGLSPSGEDLTCSAICDAAVRLASPPSKTEELNTDIMVGVVLKGGWKNPSAAGMRGGSEG